MVIYSFPGEVQAKLSEVGGKGLSLIESSKWGLPVPPGFILSVEFFDEWTNQLKQSPTWKKFLNAKEDEIQIICDLLKKEAQELIFSELQKNQLKNVLETQNGKLFAVRSSSPNEDLEGASFAGGYETVLGVTNEKLESAIKKAFCSCLDYRVVVYKKQNGFDIDDPKIAVIVQEQIDSEISGVGFSLNPVTNNYDEVVFNSNWGQGETVVSGIVSPDSFVINKLNQSIIDKTLGKKEVSIWLSENGGTNKKQNYKSDEYSLNLHQIKELTILIKKVEQLYKRPMDIEWSFNNDNLYLIQSRPITSYLPIPKEMETLIGKRKRIYADVTTIAQAIDQPVSVISTSFFRKLLKTLGNILFLRDITKSLDLAIGWISSGRIYINLSFALKLFGQEKVMGAVNAMDPLSARALSEVDLSQYKSTRPIFRMVPIGILSVLPRVFPLIERAKKNPGQVHNQVQSDLIKFRSEARDLVGKNVHLSKLAELLVKEMFFNVFIKTVPLFIFSRIYLNEIKKTAKKYSFEKAADLELALKNNVTTEMGLALFKLAQLLPVNLTRQQFEEKLNIKKLPVEFLDGWKQFLDEYGLRGPREIDIASPRYREKPEMLFDLMLDLKNSQQNSQEKFDQNMKLRENAFNQLLEKVNKDDPKKAKQLKEMYQYFDVFGGYRETHKYYLVFVVDLMRQKVLNEGKKHLKDKRLNSLDQVFDLTIEDLEKAKTDQQFDLQEKIQKNRQYIDKVSRVPHLPALIDSRGTIIRAKAQVVKDSIIGTPISAGVVRGKIKILHTPDEKPFNKGEILVARATDPGWTPLFIKASGVILEIGGVLQHGALVAREYGLPCVAGIDNATNLWKDGDEVEMDGSTGLIRLVYNVSIHVKTD